MAESLQVIALISGGKDSFFSLFHCIQNGHQVVALGNLYPAPPHAAANHAAETAVEHDLNSFMYQTVGHTVIPLYQQALGIPLYRQQIVGGAVQTGTSYGFADHRETREVSPELQSETKDLARGAEEEDETESLVPLLRRIMSEHPTANALSTGAILSTYQRTRVESVAIRSGLTPLSYLWQYPILPPGTQTSLLQDMQSVGLDARIIKVASGGLDESFLWQNVASQQVLQRVVRSVKRFGTDGDGAVLGEGGEFETLVVDGPLSLFKGRIEVLERDRRVVREGGGSAWLKIVEARVVMKESEEVMETNCRIPDLLEPKFTKILASLDKEEEKNTSLNSRGSFTGLRSEQLLRSPTSPCKQATSNDVLHWTITAQRTVAEESISIQASKAIDDIRRRLKDTSLQSTSIISALIILRSMEDFGSMNKVYGTLFTKPNPPSRVTISCGSLLPDDLCLIIHLTLHAPQHTPTQPLKALHVQSRSYWAPANIGPYSQAISFPTSTSNPSHSPISAVAIAGQIPLIPHTMALPLPHIESPDHPRTRRNFNLQATLSLQHLSRVAQQMHVSWFTSCVAYLPSRGSDIIANIASIAWKARILSRAWSLLHERDGEGDENGDEEVEERDLWEEKHYAGMEIRGAEKDEKRIPDWDVVSSGVEGRETCPPFWVVEVEELPRGSAVEWGAGWGVVGGPIKLFSQRSPDGWSVHQCAFGDTVLTVVMIDYSTPVSDVNERLEKVFRYLGVGKDIEGKSFAAYIDISIHGTRGRGMFGGQVPCRSIWDREGNRLAVVMVYDRL